MQEEFLFILIRKKALVATVSDPSIALYFLLPVQSRSGSDGAHSL
jgi:hypothetical protein